MLETKNQQSHGGEHDLACLDSNGAPAKAVDPRRETYRRHSAEVKSGQSERPAQGLGIFLCPKGAMTVVEMSRVACHTEQGSRKISLVGIGDPVFKRKPGNNDTR